MTPTLSDRLRADADRNTVSGDSGFSNEVMRDLQYTAALEREAARELESVKRQLAEAKAEMRERCADESDRCCSFATSRRIRALPLDPKEPT